MRSGSTLLMHVLTDNANITGVGEQYIRYNSTDSLWSLIYNITLTNREIPSNEYCYCDKILHNRLDQNASFFNRANIKSIFLLRQPEEVIRSLHFRKDHFPHTDTVFASSHYYQNRMSRLIEHIDRCNPDQGTYVTYDGLTRHTEESLSRITRFLDLSEPLKKEYQVKWHTGKPGVGDPGPKIRQGEIKAPDSNKYSSIEIPEIKKCNLLYNKLFMKCKNYLYQ